jgi:eukaryotic-like serine/threonine-protein kinase
LIQPDRWRQIDTLFAEALEQPAEERGAFLAAACAGDAELLRAVEELLAADEESAAFLERPAGELLGFVPEPEGRLGPYQLLRRLGDGGMGTVYLARREDEHYERDVAVKVIRSGLQSPEALHRFFAERQILARLEHPNIARLYDGGSTEDGRPYLVMELVEGVPVDDYCDGHQLSIDQRLGLFLRICAAVQYAHQNLLVHRDLKPANILVTAAGEPKLLDFGIAKRLEPGSSTVPNRTQTGLRMMTPVYASPEQVRGEAIATTSDVYALGVLLYELLAGRSPYRVGNGLPHEIERAICEQEPERPSLALFRAVDGALSPEEIAHARGTRPHGLQRRLRGDLDNIVLMALRKEPGRRYGSAGQLARDIESHLQSLPVMARPDTLPYRARKFARRHRAGMAAAAVVVLLVAGFIGSLIVQGRRITRERDKARYSLSFLLDTFKDADPYHTKGERLTADEIMTRGSERVSRDLSQQPDIQAALMDAIGEVERGLGRYDHAEPLLEQGLALRRATFGPSSLEVADSLEHLSQLKQDRSAFAEAEGLLRQALAIKRKQLGDRLETAKTLNQLGELLVIRGGAAEAETLHREALSIAMRVERAVGPTVAESLLDLAKAKKDLGKYDAAERIARQALVVERKVLGPQEPSLYLFQVNIGEVLIDTGKFSEAESLLRASLKAQREMLGREHPDVTETLANLAMALYRQGRWAEAEATNREALAIVRQQFGPSHRIVGLVLGNLAASIDAQGRPAEAISYLRQTLEIRQRNYGPDHPLVAQVFLLMAGAHRRLLQYPQAIRFAQEGLDILEKIHDPHVDSALRELGRDYLMQGRPAKAEPYLRRVLEMRRQQLSPTHLDLAKAQLTLAECLAALGQNAEAESLLRKTEPIVQRQAASAAEQVQEIQALKAKLQNRRR